MAFGSSSTLQQDDGVAAVAASSGSPGGGPGGGAAQKAEIGAFRPGSLSFGNVVLSHVVAHEWQVNSVIIKVTTPPASAYDFDIDIGGTVVTVTLPGGQSLMTASIDEGISAESEVRVTAKSNDTDIEDIRTTLDVS